MDTKQYIELMVERLQNNFQLVEDLTIAIISVHQSIERDNKCFMNISYQDIETIKTIICQ